jgi:hypothetical protein
MKALTLWQPWAEAIARRLKPHETRSWGTDYRGPLAIHAGKNFPPAAMQQCELMGWGASRASSDLIFSAVICTCTLVDCFQLTHANWYEKLGRDFQHDPAYKWGNYDFGRFVWVLQNVRRLRAPAYCSGQRQLWNWSEAQAA